MSVLTPINDILARLATLDVTNAQGQTVKLYTRIWNNQFRLEAAGNIEAFPRPCAFLEILKGKAGDSSIGQGFTGSDIKWRIHISHELYDAGDGAMEQDSGIFALVDQVVALLTYYEPPFCSGLMCIDDGQDYSHSNIYHYTVDFICHYIEPAGDQTLSQIQSTPPTALDLVAGYAPVEILSVSYAAGSITIHYNLLTAQDLQFTLPVAGLTDAGTQPAGQGAFIHAVSLSPGSYLLTATVATPAFTTAAFPFTIS